jgi:hypothetical protein
MAKPNLELQTSPWIRLSGIVMFAIFVPTRISIEFCAHRLEVRKRAGTTIDKSVFMFCLVIFASFAG